MSPRTQSIRRTVTLALSIWLLLVCRAGANENNTFQQQSPTEQTTKTTQNSTIPQGITPSVNKIGEKLEGVAYEMDGFRAYHVIEVNKIELKYLFFVLIPNDDYDEMGIDMTIYKENDPNPLKKCLNDQVDSCYIPRESFQLNEKVMVIVQCGEQTKYELVTYWSEVEHIGIDREIRFMFNDANKRQLYHLQLNGLQFEELRIIIKPQTRRHAFEYVKMFGKYGQDSEPDEQRYDFRSVHMWQDVEGVYLHRSEIKDLNLNLILYGSIETVYTITCTVVNKTHNDMLLGVKLYQYLGNNQEYLYHATFKDAEGKFSFEEYVLRVSTFNGDLKLSYYLDSQRKSLFKTFPYFYMGDAEFIFSKAEVQALAKGLYIFAKSKQRVSTFLVHSYGRNKRDALELSEHIYEFFPVGIRASNKVYFDLHRYKDANTMEDASITFSVIPVKGTFDVKFLQCYTDIDQCLKNTKTPEMKNYKTRQIGTKRVYEIELQSSVWREVNLAEDITTFVAIVTNTNDQESFVALEYLTHTLPFFLRENKPVEAFIQSQEIRTFKYRNEDPNVKTLRLHINQISGHVQFMLFRDISEPAEEEIDKRYQVHGPIIDVSDRLLEKPIVLLAQGTEDAIFSVTLQVIHSDQGLVSAVSLSENVQFNYRLSPNHYEIFEMHPISDSIYFKYKSTGLVHVCILNEQNVCTDKKPVLLNANTLTIKDIASRTVKIKLRNPSSSRNIDVTAIYHSSDVEHCRKFKFGQLYAEATLVKEACLSVIIPQGKDFELFFSRQEFGELEYTILLCERAFSMGNSPDGEIRMTVSAVAYAKECQGHASQELIIALNGKVTEKSGIDEKIKLQFLVQSTDGRVVLPDGVAYKGHAKVTDNFVQWFVYDLVSKEDTEIVLFGRGRFEFDVKIVDTALKLTEEFNNGPNEYASANSFFSSPSLKLTKAQIQDSKCGDCSLLIALYCNEQMGSTVDYSIQVTQNYGHLTEGHAKQNFLTKGSRAYYSYDSTNAGSIFVEVADNNRHCAIIYLSRLQFPDQNNFMERTYDNQLIHEVVQGPYYISVQAQEHCAYTISVTTSTQRNIVKLQRGQMGLVNLKQGEVKYFTFHHKSPKGFKVISLHRYGSVRLYLNTTNNQQLLQLMSGTKIDYKKFNYTSPYDNKLFVDTTNAIFCADCFYILAIEALKHTESSVFLGDGQTNIPIGLNKLFDDILPTKGSSTRASLYEAQSLVLEITVFGGKLQVEATRNKKSIKKEFVPSSTLQKFPIDLETSHRFEPISFKFVALQDNTVYTVMVGLADNHSGNNSPKELMITPGFPKYFYSEADVVSCINGHIRNGSEKIFLSTNWQEKNLLNDLVITAKLQLKEIEIHRELARNVLQISFPTLNQTLDNAKPYNICILHRNKQLSFTAMQTEDTNLLPENVEITVLNKQIFTIYPEGEFLFDLFSCRGSASVIYADSMANLLQPKDKQLDIVKMPGQTHATKVSRYSMILVQVTGNMSTVRWFPIRQDREQGVGYMVYDAGDIKYDSAFNRIDLTIEAVKKVQETKTIITNIKYTFFVSNKLQNLKETSLCERFQARNVLLSPIVDANNSTNYITYTIEKKILMERFKEAQNLYVTVVADLELQTPNPAPNKENYRFVYAPQEIPAEIFMPNQFESLNTVLLIVLVLSVIVALVIFTYACTQVIGPMISRLRSSNIVFAEEAEKSTHEGHIQAPQSSDRQGVQVNNVIETEEKMDEPVKNES